MTVKELKEELQSYNDHATVVFNSQLCNQSWLNIDYVQVVDYGQIVILGSHNV